MSRQVRTLFILAVVLVLSVASAFLLPNTPSLGQGFAQDVNISLSHGVGNFVVGINGTLTVTIQNVGSATTAGAISAVVHLPNGLTYVSDSGGTWTCTPPAPGPGARDVSCTYGGPALTPLSVTGFNITVSVGTIAAPSVTVSADVTMVGDQNAANNSTGPHTINVDTSPTLVVAKSHSGNFTVGQTGTYTIRLNNAGSLPTSGTITITDRLPAANMVSTGASGTNWNCSGIGTAIVTCTTTQVIAGGGTAPDITLTVNPLAPGTVDNSVDAVGGGSPLPDSAVDSTNIIAGPDLGITKSHIGNFTVGQQNTYTITVTNSASAGGPANVPFAVVDTLPANLTFVSGSGTGWNACTAAGQVVTCNGALPIAVGNSSTITLTVLPTAAGTIGNTAQLNPTAAGDTNAANNTSPVDTTIIDSIDLSITKSHTGNFTRGLPGTFDITVNNIGSGPTVAPIAVTDTLPAGLTFVAAGSGGSGFTCSAVGQNVTCNSAGPIANGASVSFPINVAVGATAGTGTPLTVVNKATVATTFDVNAANNTSPDDTVTIDAADLTITKSVVGGATNLARGTSPTFRFVVANGGAAASTGTVTINDTLPTGITYAGSFTLVDPSPAPPGATPTCSGTTSIVCTYGASIAPGGSITFDVDVDVDAAAPLGPTTNTATVVNPAETPATNNSSTINLVIDPAPVPDLTLTKTNGGTFQVGSNGTFILTVTNQGNKDTTTATTVTDTLPSGFNYVSSSPAGWTCVPAAGPPVVVTCQFAGVIGQGAGNAQALTLTVAPTTAGGFTNNATVAGGGEVNLANDSANSSGNVAPAPSPDAAITKSASGTTYVQNVLNSFVIAVSNAGGVDINGGTTVRVTDNLSSGMTFIAAGSGTGGWVCPVADVVGGPGVTVVCNHPGPVTAGTALPNLIFNVQPTALGNIPNSATVSLIGQTDGNAANNTSTVTVNVLPPNTPDLRITKTHADPFTQGVLSSYSIAVQNVGSGDTTGIITVVDTLPPGMTFSSGTGGGFTCNLTTPPSTVTCTSPGPITAGSTATITLNVNPGTVGSGTNVATVSTPGDPNAGNNTSNDITNISGIPDLTVSKTHAGNFYVGQTDAQYTITVNNIGSGASTGTITVADTLPAGLTFNAVTSGSFTCGPANSVNPTCTSSSSIPAGGSLSFTMRVNVPAAGAGTNLVAVSGGGETNAANNNGSDPTTIDAAASIDLQLVSKTGPASFTVGTNGTYTITVRNIGNASSTGTITVADTLPAGMTLQSSSGGIFTCTGTGTANVSCTSPGPLAANQTATITLTVLPDNTTAASVTNTATVSGGGDTNAANNQASTPAIPVVGAPNLQISKIHSGNFFAGQTNAAYTITVTNVGNGPTTGAITVTDNLPLGMTLSTYTGLSGTWTCSGSSTVTCTSPGPITAGGSSQVRIFVNTPAAGGPVTNTATVSTPGEGNTGDNNGPDILQTIVTSQPDLSGASITISANPTTNVNADGSTTSTITVNVTKGGLPMGGVPTNISVTPSGATLSGQVNTDNNGNATFTIKSTTATTYTITPTFPTSINVPSLPTTTVAFITPTATATPNSAQATSTAAAAVAAGSSNPQGSTVTVDCTTVPADNVFKANITVTLRNSSGGAVPSKNVSLTSSPALTGLVITPTQGVSDTNGQVKFTAQSPTQGGPITFTATNTSDSITIGTVQVTFGKPGTQAVCPAPGTGAGGLPATSLNLLNLPLDGPGIGQVIPYRLRVRTGPGLQFPQIGTLQARQLVTLLGRDSRGRWFLIRLQNGGVGWVSAFYIRVRRLAFRHLPIVDQAQLVLPVASAPGVAPTPTR